jgi:hypothetical protein
MTQEKFFFAKVASSLVRSFEGEREKEKEKKLLNNIIFFAGVATGVGGGVGGGSGEGLKKRQPDGPKFATNIATCHIRLLSFLSEKQENKHDENMRSCVSFGPLYYS